MSKVKRFGRESVDGQMDRPTDGQTDGHYQVHYLPASRSIEKFMKSMKYVSVFILLPEKKKMAWESSNYGAMEVLRGNVRENQRGAQT